MLYSLFKLSVVYDAMRTCITNFKQHFFRIFHHPYSDITWVSFCSGGNDDTHVSSHKLAYNYAIPAGQGLLFQLAFQQEKGHH